MASDIDALQNSDLVFDSSLIIGISTF